MCRESKETIAGSEKIGERQIVVVVFLYYEVVGGFRL
jgi:hypothetical protein